MTLSRLAQASGLALVPLLSTAGGDAEGDKPNVLYIAIDELNGWIGVLGNHPQVQTPNIDRLAKRGVLFTDVHCAAAACSPSRTSVKTGLRPSTSGAYSNNQDLRTSKLEVGARPWWVQIVDPSASIMKPSLPNRAGP